MADKQNVLVEKNKVVQGREAVDAYRVAHTALHSHGWYKGISEDHTPLLNTLLSSLKVSGFNSLDEYFLAEKPYLNGFLCEEFEVQAIQREVRFIDLSSHEYVYNMAAQEAIEALRTLGRSPDTFLISHSAVEQKLCLQINRGTNTETAVIASEVIQEKIPIVRMLCYGWKPVFVSPQCPQPSLISRGIYDEKTGLALWQEIMRQVWEHFGIITTCEVNDVLVGDKKIAGLWIGESIAQAVCSLDLDFTLADKIIPPLTGVSHEALTASQRMTTAKIEAGRNIDFDEFFLVLKETLQRILHLTFVAGSLTTAEEERIAYYLPKYSSSEWTWQGDKDGD